MILTVGGRHRAVRRRRKSWRIALFAVLLAAEVAAAFYGVVLLYR